MAFWGPVWTLNTLNRMYRCTYIGTKFVSICSLLSQKITANWRRRWKRILKKRRSELGSGSWLCFHRLDHAAGVWTCQFRSCDNLVWVSMGLGSLLWDVSGVTVLWHAVKASITPPVMKGPSKMEIISPIAD